MQSAKSIFNYINQDENLKQSFFRICGAYFTNDKYVGDASRITTFIKQENVLEDFLKEHLSNDIAKELSRKEGDKYLYSNKIILSTLCQQAKINNVKSANYCVTYLPSAAIAMSTFALSVNGIFNSLSASEVFQASI